MKIESHKTLLKNITNAQLPQFSQEDVDNIFQGPQAQLRAQLQAQHEVTERSEEIFDQPINANGGLVSVDSAKPDWLCHRNELQSHMAMDTNRYLGGSTFRIPRPPVETFKIPSTPKLGRQAGISALNSLHPPSTSADNLRRKHIHEGTAHENDTRRIYTYKSPKPSKVSLNEGTKSPMEATGLFPLTPLLGRFTGFGMPVTPHLMNLCSASPTAGIIPMEVLTTPALFPKRVEAGVPDILQMIDRDDSTLDVMEKKLLTYDIQNITDESLADYILEITDDYAPMDTNVKFTSVLPSNPKRVNRRKGRHGKRLSKEIDGFVKQEKQKRSKENRLKKKSKIKACASKEPSVDSVESLRRRVQTHGRRTRSLVRACKELGLANNDQEIDEIFQKKASIKLED